MANTFVKKSKKRTGTVIARSIYGLLVVTALIVALEGLIEDPWQITISLFSTMFVIGLAESYSDIIGYRLEHSIDITKEEAREKIKEAMTVLVSSFIPILIFLAASFGFYSVDIAFQVAKIFAVVILFTYGFAFGRRTGRSYPRTVGIGVVDAVLGMTIILFKASLDHI